MNDPNSTWKSNRLDQCFSNCSFDGQIRVFKTSGYNQHFLKNENAQSIEEKMRGKNQSLLHIVNSMKF